MECDRARYEIPLRELRRLKRYQPDNYRQLEHFVLKACEDARLYSKDKDPNETRRKEDTDMLREIPAQLKAIKRLRQFILLYPGPASMALPAPWYCTFGPSETGDSDEKGPSVSEYYIGLLDRYAEALQRDLLAKRGPFVHRFKVGPLVYPRPVDHHPARINVRAMGLLFQLVLYFRRFTYGIRSVGRLQHGEPMPSYGKPYYGIAVEFVNAATGEPFGTASEARDRLNKLLAKNPGIGFGQWPRSLAAGKKTQE